MTNETPTRPGNYLMQTHYDFVNVRHDLVQVYYAHDINDGYPLGTLVCESTIFNVKPPYEGYFGFTRQDPDNHIQPMSIFDPAERYLWTELIPALSQEWGGDTDTVNVGGENCTQS